MSSPVGVSELDGTFGHTIDTSRPCPKCGSSMTCRPWESSCGGFEDEKFTCSNAQCGHSYWVEGIDS